MKLATKIFKKSNWYVTSKFGWRTHPISKKRTFHYGTDYGTNVKKWPQYALEDGYVHIVHNKDNGGYGKYIWVRYPRINRSLLHAHLSTISVKKGQKVKSGTLLGYTGTTGNSTGIHLHLGMTKIGSNKYLDPHAYDYKEPSVLPAIPTPMLRKGSKGTKVTNLQKCLKYVGYALSIDGVFGNETFATLKKFQTKYKLGADGIYGRKSYNKFKTLIK